jgi:ribosomal protein S18 acetylase RimI-like enzyme
VLRKMRQEEFLSYRDYFIADYSQEISLNYSRTMADSVSIAEQDLLCSFPDGVESKGQELVCIEAKVAGQIIVVGYLWYTINIEDQTAFICDFYITEPHRSKQFGRHAMSELEEQLKNNGIHQIKLRVAYYNKRAFALYEKIGFVVTGYNMSKNIV